MLKHFAIFGFAAACLIGGSSVGMTKGASGSSNCIDQPASTGTVSAGSGSAATLGSGSSGAMVSGSTTDPSRPSYSGAASGADITPPRGSTNASGGTVGTAGGSGMAAGRGC